MNNPSDTPSPFGEDLWVVLGRYTSGESSPAETGEVRRWLAQDPRREQLLSALERAAHHPAPSSPTGADTERQWQRLAARLDQPDVLDLESRRVRHTIVGLRAAAIVLAAVGSTLIWYRLRIQTIAQPSVVISALNYNTRVGQRDSLSLPDGSTVLLGPASRLALPEEFGTATRDVRLEGEAFFRVTHNAAHPFRVRVAGAVVEDLGTAFAVREDAGEVNVVVQSGLVSLRDSAAAGTLQLQAGDRGAVVSGRVMVERAGATADDMAWTHGRLVFTGAAMPVVAAELRRWYGVDLQITDPAVASKHLTAAFAGESGDQVLNMIGLALGAAVERRGDTVMLRPK